MKIYVVIDKIAVEIKGILRRKGMIKIWFWELSEDIYKGADEVVEREGEEFGFVVYIG